ncbi:hypothetical protein [Dysgonomonas termitidis]|uniref:Uncharacterized protein n=1 Tax=Dysgonomonas termitidis TaxID=1516126 RepID=A0ABV9KV28_9BACT
MNKEIDKLLRLLDEDPDGILLSQIIYDKKFGIPIIKKAKSLGYIKYYNEEIQKDTDILHDKNFCKITDQGSQLLNQEGGLEKYIKRNKASFIISIIAVAIAFCSLVLTLLK